MQGQGSPPNGASRTPGLRTADSARSPEAERLGSGKPSARGGAIQRQKRLIAAATGTSILKSKASTSSERGAGARRACGFGDYEVPAQPASGRERRRRRP